MTAREKPTLRVPAKTKPPAHSHRVRKEREAPTVPPTDIRRARKGGETGQTERKGKVQVDIVVADLSADPRSEEED